MQIKANKRYAGSSNWTVQVRTHELIIYLLKEVDQQLNWDLLRTFKFLLRRNAYINSKSFNVKLS